MIEAVTFDFWNTIATVPPGAMSAARERAIAAACASSEVEVEADLLLESLERVGLDWERSWAEGRHLHPHEAAASLVRALGVERAAREMVAEAFLGAGREVELELAPGIGSCLEAMTERGVRLGIVCDVGFSGGELLRELLEAEGLLQHFSGWGFSDEVGHYKPAPEIFEAALGALAVEPARAMHVGDLRSTDVAGAARLGMRTVRYRYEQRGRRRRRGGGGPRPRPPRAAARAARPPPRVDDSQPQLEPEKAPQGPEQTDLFLTFARAQC